ncbi:YkgJ family cysteine cluster protein [Ramlibacter sp. WS9]|uniref:YkgJ family cysteine cluster protein n=1 Tax=Ramlibacter sp. WS9 TaxID=1882741 RepID=UPI00114320B4|nr:YkgJ family cysteine cluster protein [Ramlibacter sp. WS9]ROZ62574.1 YkgJ family cysteine cluster protein [Ramlibacter sp. WS9]
MHQESNVPSERLSADFTLTGGDFRLTFRATVPGGPSRMSDLLPLVRSLSDTVIGETCRTLEASGRRVSCASGCGACCRNLVEISQVEARRIADVVAALPEPRRATVESRFAHAKERLEQAGLLERLRVRDEWTPQEYAAQVDSYFALNAPCPFLEEESCSIYEERPITCREYLVTSHPALCANLDSAGVERVQLPLQLFNAMARWQAPQKGPFLEQWVPLVLALEWAALHPDEPPSKTGLELLRELLSQVST